MASLSPFVFLKKLSPSGMGGSFKKSSTREIGRYRYVLMGGATVLLLMGTPAFANAPTSLLNPKIQQNTDTKNTPSTDSQTPATPTPEQSNKEQEGAEKTAPDNQPPTDNTEKKALDDLLDELNQAPDYSEKTQPATTPQAGLIQTDTLQTISEDSFGLIEPNQDNIGLWDNTSYSHLMNLLQGSTLSITSPTLYKSTLDTLLLGARSPVLEPPHKQGDYLLQRVALLSRSGHIKTAKKLFSDSPIGTAPKHHGLLLNLALLGHDIPSVCGLSKQMSEASEIPPSVDSLLIKQMNILCKGISDNPASAYIAASALQETSEDVSFLFVDTLDFLNGGPAPDAQSLTELTPFNLLLARVTGMPINQDLLAKASPDILHSASAHPNTTDDARIYALERLAHTGAISATELAAGYNRVTFTTEQLQSPLTFLYDLPPPLQRALLVQASQGENGWKHAITLLNRMNTAEDYTMISNILASDFAKLTPSPEYEYAAAIITRSLLASGYGEQAQQWYQAREQFDSRTNNAIAMLYPALLLSNNSTNTISLDETDTKTWAEQMSKNKTDGLKALTRGLSVLQALGFDIDERLWDYLNVPAVHSNDKFSALPNSGIALLEKYAQTGLFTPKGIMSDAQQTDGGASDIKQPSKKQRGMTTLYAMNLVGKETASNLSDGQVIRIIKALHQSFGVETARSYALEALVRQYD